MHTWMDDIDWLRELLVTENFDVPVPPIPDRLPRIRRVADADKVRYLKLRGWKIEDNSRFKTLTLKSYHLDSPRTADCGRLSEAFTYQTQMDMKMVLRRFGYTPIVSEFEPRFWRDAKLHKQFFELLASGLLKETNYLELQAIHMPGRGKMLSVWCHYCFQFHNHGEGDGHRCAHCHSSNSMSRGYVLVDPSDKPQTLLDVYRPLEADIRKRRETLRSMFTELAKASNDISET